VTDENQFYGIESDPMRDAFDKTEPIPDWEHAKEPLRSLCERKNITLDDLVRIGARLKDKHGTTLAYSMPLGIKYRDVITGKKWSEWGSDWSKMKDVPGRDSSKLVLVEGETDAARMSGKDGPGWDVGIMAAGTHVYPEYIETADSYEWVYVATDDDSKGDEAASKIMHALPGKTVRWRPPENTNHDWCGADEIGKPPMPPQKLPAIVWGESLHEIDYPDTPSLLDNAMLPDNGMLFIHGWKGAYKSWLAFDLAVALATGTPWGSFDTTQPECKVVVVQFELPFAYYAERMRGLSHRLPEYAREKYKNVGTYNPLEKMRLDISNQKTQDHFLEVFTKNKVQVAIFDPIRRMSGAKSHYEQEWQSAVVDFSTRLNQAGIAVVLTHHDGKAAARHGGGSMLDASAADAIVGATDASVSIALPKGEDWESSKKRNLIFYSRNAETPAPRGFSIDGDQIAYHDEPFYGGDTPDDAPPI